MRLALVSALVLSISGLGDTAGAQSRLLRTRKKEPEKKSKLIRRPPPKPAPNVCPSQSAVLAQEQQRLASYQGEAAGVDAEIASLQRRLTDLRARKAELSTMVAAQKSRVERAAATYKANCEKSENCQQYEDRAAMLERQSKPVETELDSVRGEIERAKAEVRTLRSTIEPLRREYQSKSCDNLVPGETAQSTIDRCSAIFSDWNRSQGDLNRHNNRLPALKSRHEQLLAQWVGIEERAKKYEAYMAKHCKKSSKLVRLRGYGGVRQRARTLGGELDRLINDVTQLRGIRITVH